MKPDRPLAELEPHWVEHEGKVCGVRFQCPEHHGTETWCLQVVPFSPALDGTVTKSWQSNGHQWQRTGETFETLTLTPSIKASCGYHGFITGGIVTCCGDSK
jgi:hypothetical protein